MGRASELASGMAAPFGRLPGGAPTTAAALRILAAATAALGAGLLLLFTARRQGTPTLGCGHVGSAGDEAVGEDEGRGDRCAEEDEVDVEELASSPLVAAGTLAGDRDARVARRGPNAVHSADDDRRGELPGRQRVFVKTMGCAHNSSDGEFMMGLLQEYGYQLVSAMEEADVCLVNSCTVKNPSQDSATNLVKRARAGGKPVVLAGCVPSADASVADGLEGVSLLGVAQIDRIVEVVEQALLGNTVRLLGKRRVLPSLELPKVRRNSCVEIIPISGGCLGNCSYCKTKHARGKLSSYGAEAIVQRALLAASEGASEVWLASEDTGAWGIDLGTDIAALLGRVADALPPGVMLKLGMTNPPYMLAHIGAVAEVLQRPNVFEFIHVPVQSGSDRVLQAMVREYTVADFSRLVDGLRGAVPGVLVATDIICGFPTESEEDHEETLELVRRYKFPVLNISQFYPRPGTPAARMKRLPGSLGKKRSSEVTQLFDSYETNRHLVGQELRAWFSETETKHGQTVGHTKGYVKVVVPRDDGLLGRTARVRVHGATKWHIEAEVVGA